jgi:hypothetical protein
LADVAGAEADTRDLACTSTCAFLFTCFIDCLHLSHLCVQPKFIEPAQQHLPFLPRYAICMSIPTVREYFFTSCHGFSMYFPTLISAEGVEFRAECARRGKKVTVWTVNKEEEMKECLRWGVQAVITDNPDITVGLVDKVRLAFLSIFAVFCRSLELTTSIFDCRSSRTPQLSSHPTCNNSFSPGRQSNTTPSTTRTKPSWNVITWRGKVGRSMMLSLLPQSGHRASLSYRSP